MDVSPLNSTPVDSSTIPLESLAANKSVSQSEKIAQASRAFEAMLLRQILSESQKPVFKSKFVSDSTSDGIYRDQMVNQLAESISKSGSFGLGRTLAAELQRQTHSDKSGQTAGSAKSPASQNGGQHVAGLHELRAPGVSARRPVHSAAVPTASVGGLSPAVGATLPAETTSRHGKL
jgi:Rod binding domain-containing protein